jgi:hypothetical protein
MPTGLFVLHPLTGEKAGRVGRQLRLWDMAKGQ